MSEQYWRLVEQAPDAIFISREFRITFLNPAAVRLSARPPRTNCWGGRCSNWYIRTAAAACAKTWTGGWPGRARRRSRRESRADASDKDKQDKHVEIAVSAADDGPGAPSSSSLRDITAQQARRGDAARERRTADARRSPARRKASGTGTSRPTRSCIPPRWKQMLGYADDEIEPHVSAWERLRASRRSAARRPRATTAWRAASGRPTKAEFRLRHKDGHYVHVLSRGFPVRREPGGPVVRIVGTHLDLTERKRAEAALRENEERLKLAFAGAQEGVWDWNLETGAVVYSSRWKRCSATPTTKSSRTSARGSGCSIPTTCERARRG